MFKQSKVKVGPETETLFVDIQFLESPQNRKRAADYGYMTEADLNYGISCLEQKNSDFCSNAAIYGVRGGNGVVLIETVK